MEDGTDEIDRHLLVSRYDALCRSRTLCIVARLAGVERSGFDPRGGVVTLALRRRLVLE